MILVILTSTSSLVWLKRHLTLATVTAGVAVVAGMWLERWSIIVPSVTHPRLVAWSTYTPTSTEWSLTAASVALFALLLMAFFKLFPAISIWEVAEGRVIDEVEATIHIPLPPESPSTELRS
jgi:Ni/Fe-hydrogenase subunit HybB-like protein